jgi:hypothetical protein
MKIVNTFIMEIEKIGLPETIFVKIHETDSKEYFIEYSNGELKKISLNDFIKIYNKNNKHIQ